uniref:Large ribosomal subunit protein bL32c n=1 Tax=Phoradendron leucarpum TaxID=3970 RepID=D3WCN5_PHOLC|nr:ribosomal protein L32 [Phoradendron leucarpum]
MTVPKKRTSILKKNIRKRVWKNKVYRVSQNALSLAKSLYTGKSKGFFCNNKEGIQSGLKN